MDTRPKVSKFPVKSSSFIMITYKYYVHHVVLLISTIKSDLITIAITALFNGYQA